MQGPPNTVRLNMELRLTARERRAFEALSASELRTSGRMATRILVRHLAQRAKSLPAHPIPGSSRARWSVQVRLTPAQRRELGRRAREDGRSLGNLATVLVVQAIRPLV